MMLTPWEFDQLYEHFMKGRTTDQEQQVQLAWEVARWQVFRTLCPPEGKMIRITDLIRFTWDKQAPEQEPSTEERFRDCVKRFNCG